MDGKIPFWTDARFDRAVLEALHADDFPHQEHPELPDPPDEERDPVMRRAVAYEHETRKWAFVRLASRGW